ncbi:MAG: cobyric acid synthase [Spirochaetes bacterium]|nr:cobyric acid synthase [Spirochaetota bacterium]
MVQGTASSVGKSIITAALCRIFLQDGYTVAPFKSQNMALNSFVTAEGDEMGRAQVVQAEACRVAPSVLMNPILIKPTTDKTAQIIINGRVFKNMSAEEYHKIKPDIKGIVMGAYNSLSRQYNIIVIEGAGSPAEINLRENDLVNMGMAEMADAPVILVADIDRGGVFASIVGTFVILNEEEKARIKGIIINKFRGDIELLKPGIAAVENIVQVPVVGVIPYMKINLEDEDSVTERFTNKDNDNEITIDVVRLPRISNFSDFDAFNIHDDVSVNFVESAREIKDPDVIILPGTKNTIDDMAFIRENGIEEKILEHYRKGRPVIGICGGYQMLGNTIEDPSGVESSMKMIDGMGILNMKTVMSNDKRTLQVAGEIITDAGIMHGLKGEKIKGYEIHMGGSFGVKSDDGLCRVQSGIDGTVIGNVVGTYIHGLFDSAEFTRGLLNNIREIKGLDPLENMKTFSANKEMELDKLAEAVRNNIDLKKIYNILYDDNVACC